MERKCQICGCKLSIYNSDKLCFLCQDKKQEEMFTKLTRYPSLNLRIPTFHSDLKIRNRQKSIWNSSPVLKSASG
jgi:hypothetical protein